MNSIHKRCNIEVDECPVTQADNDETYAYKRRSFIISTNREHAADAPLYKVNKIDFLPARVSRSWIMTAIFSNC